METDEQRQNRAFRELVRKWQEEGNFANGYFATLGKRYHIPVRPLKKRWQEYQSKGYDISVWNRDKLENTEE